jgi:hypothetical protein
VNLSAEEILSPPEHECMKAIIRSQAKIPMAMSFQRNSNANLHHSGQAPRIPPFPGSDDMSIIYNSASVLSVTGEGLLPAEIESAFCVSRQITDFSGGRVYSGLYREPVSDPTEGHRGRTYGHFLDVIWPFHHERNSF